MRILVVNGPNLNLLGKRESSHYGTLSLLQLEEKIREHVGKKAELLFFQSNHEGEIVDFLQSLKETDALILNAAAFTHTSVAIRDALLATKTPFIEVHLSNVYARESFRQKSYLSDISRGVIYGFGAEGYLLAADYFLRTQATH
ncbi:MAG: 3-dehydroquinate dehydratase [Turneriella sp.]|nr:3-dehydroquinate dehydratase [Turneriella sp.]